MTLLLTLTAAVAATIVWYFSENARAGKIGVLCYIYWGAAIMWFVDAIYEYDEMGAAYFQPSAQDLLNDTFLGFAVIVLALVIWTIFLLVKDPKCVVKDTLRK